jgi:hypothetical protein
VNKCFVNVKINSVYAVTPKQKKKKQLHWFGTGSHEFGNGSLVTIFEN